MPLDLRQALVSTVDELYGARLITATGGNVSVRAGPDAAWITPKGLFKGGLRIEDLVPVGLDGRVPGQGGAPSSETPLHLAIYRARPDVGAIIHSHPPLATVFGLCGLKMKPVTAGAAAFLDLPVVEFLPPGSPELADATAAALGRGPAVLLRSHGAVVVGVHLRQAADRTHALEETCLILLLARLLGTEPAVIPGPLLKSLHPE